MSAKVASRATPEPYYLTAAEKTAIIAERMAGVKVADIAKRYKCNEVTVWRICKTMQEASKAVAREWREEQTELAIQAVNAGLVHPEDPYKRATIGVQALKGLGVYAADSANVSVTTLVSNAPAEVSAIVQALPKPNVLELEATPPTDTATNTET